MLLIAFPEQELETEFEFDYYVAPYPYAEVRHENIKVEQEGNIFNFAIEKKDSENKFSLEEYLEEEKPVIFAENSK